MKKLILTAAMAHTLFASVAQTTVTVDKNWTSNSAAIKNSMEADFIIRLGDIDNLGFGWPEGFDPFCGRMTEAHYYPWDANASDIKGMDRILLSGKFAGMTGCADGYAESYNAATSKPTPWALPLDILAGAEIKNVYLQLFIDDFQSPSHCSRFTITLNGIRFVEGEKLLNAIDQTGPVGKLITLPVPEEFYPALKNKSLEIKIDEATGAADGFAIDFIRLLVNRKRENTCKGDISGHVYDKETGNPIAGALVWLSDKTSVKSDEDGIYTLKGIPTGFEVLTASATGYADSTAGADIGEGSGNPEVNIYLPRPTRSATFNNKNIRVGESISLNNILFDQGKSTLRPEAKPELDRIIAFMKQNPTAEIELAGHTSSEGDAAINRSLSYQRVKSCKDYIVTQGIETGRIVSVGYGPDRPVASNNDEAGRSQNRRVEMRLLKL